MARKVLDSHGSADDVTPDYTGTTNGHTFETFIQRPIARGVGPDGRESKVLGWHVVTMIDGALYDTIWYATRAEAHMRAKATCA